MFAVIVFANVSGMENYTILVNLTMLGSSQEWTDREQYTHHSGMFSVYLSARMSCSMVSTAGNDNTTGWFRIHACILAKI